MASVLVQACLAMAMAVMATVLTGCGADDIVMTLGLNYVCKTEGVNGCEAWTQSGVAGTDEEPDSFKVKVDYKCQEFSSQGYCKTWSQKGSAIKETVSSGCFPGNAVVRTPTGPKPMSTVSIGDELLGMDYATGKPMFSKVKAWIHRDVDADAEMTVLTTEQGRVVATAKHNIATEQGRYVFADSFKVGDVLVSPDGVGVIVSTATTEGARGLYSPLTESSNFFAGESEHSLVLAHSFAHIWWPRMFEGIFNRILDIAESFWPEVHNVKEGDRHYVHPIARRFAPLVGVYV